MENETYAVKNKIFIFNSLAISKIVYRNVEEKKVASSCMAYTCLLSTWKGSLVIMKGSNPSKLWLDYVITCNPTPALELNQIQEPS